MLETEYRAAIIKRYELLESRIEELVDSIVELENFDTDGLQIKRTTVYRLIKKEWMLLAEESLFLEELGVVNWIVDERNKKGV